MGVRNGVRSYLRRVRSLLCQRPPNPTATPTTSKNTSAYVIATTAQDEWTVTGITTDISTTTSAQLAKDGEGSQGATAPPPDPGTSNTTSNHPGYLDVSALAVQIPLMLVKVQCCHCLSSEDISCNNATEITTVKKKKGRNRNKLQQRETSSTSNCCCAGSSCACRCLIRVCCTHSQPGHAKSACCNKNLSASPDAKNWFSRNQAEVGHTCRGSINLQGAFIHTEDSFKFIVSNGGTHTFHLKASSEVERQKWVTALELARVRAIKEAESDEEEELKMDEQGQTERNDLQNTLRAMQAKLDDLTTCQDLIVKHALNVQKALADLEAQAQNQNSLEALSVRIKSVNERATLFRITTNAAVNACSEFVTLAQGHGKKWQRVLQHEHEQRVRLQETLEQLARQHAALERATSMHEPGSVRLNIQSDEESEFHDALEEIGDLQFYTARPLKRTGSEVSEQLTVDHDSEDQGETLENGNPRSKNMFNDISSANFITITSPDSAGLNTTATSSITSNATSSNGDTCAKKKRRASIPPKPNTSLSLWSIMKNCIGKDLSRIPVPVNFNEPLSMMQRITEDLEYSSILDRAQTISDSCEQLAYVAAFTVSSYSTTVNRTGKPFNPVLGETYECDRMDDFGWRSITEQVSHHPPAAAMFVEARGWKLWQEITMSSKFRGKYLQIIPLGISHLEFDNSGNHYTWRKVATTVHNIIVGKLWIDNHGDMVIENHKTGDKCHLKYLAYSYFSRETPRKVTGVVTNSAGVVKWVIQGTWDEYIECAKVVGQADKNTQAKPVFETLPPKCVWRKNPQLPGCENFYNFTQLAVELNEPDESVAPTDSRRRPDQRLHELGDWDKANTEKVRIEDKQRAVRRKREADAEIAISDGRPFVSYEPLWFSKEKDPWTGNLIHTYKGEYWQKKEKQQWNNCPDIF